MSRTVLVFGATGAIGRHLCERFAASGDRVVGVSRGGRAAGAAPAGVVSVACDPLASPASLAALGEYAPYAAVCWAQGANRNDSVQDVDAAAHLDLYRVNALYNVLTLQALLRNDWLTRPARLCVISSVWQNLARQNKLSYCMSKAALQGFVLSAAADLAADGHLVNAVLPGAVDTPMTRRNLSAAQIERFADATPFRRLPGLDDVAAAVAFLCAEANTGITGQFLAVDLGFTHVRLV